MNTDQVKYQESSIGFENIPYLQSIEKRCNSVLHLSRCSHIAIVFYQLPCNIFLIEKSQILLFLVILL